MSTRHNGVGRISVIAANEPFGGFRFGDPVPWMEHGLCSQADPEAWFPDRRGSTREAKAVCARCPVAAECLDYALAHGERFGIWGGLSERERRKITTRMNRPPQPKEQPSQEHAS